jgi:hypothetical protein
LAAAAREPSSPWSAARRSPMTQATAAASGASWDGRPVPRQLLSPAARLAAAGKARKPASASSPRRPPPPPQTAAGRKQSLEAVRSPACRGLQSGWPACARGSAAALPRRRAGC